MSAEAFTIMNVIGLLAFAIVGSLKAVDAELDFLGVTILGVVTALGGGTIRDLLVNQVPNSLHSTIDISVALLGVFIALTGVWTIDGFANHPVVVISDAVGLAAFATTGALVAHSAETSPFGILILAMVTGAGGGALADLLRGEIPFVLKEDFYATCALIGAGTFWLLISTDISTQTSAVACAVTILIVRILAIYWEWHLPQMGRIAQEH